MQYARYSRIHTKMQIKFECTDVRFSPNAKWNHTIKKKIFRIRIALKKFEAHGCGRCVISIYSAICRARARALLHSTLLSEWQSLLIMHPASNQIIRKFQIFTSVRASVNFSNEDWRTQKMRRLQYWVYNVPTHNASICAWFYLYDALPYCSLHSWQFSNHYPLCIYFFSLHFSPAVTIHFVNVFPSLFTAFVTPQPDEWHKWANISNVRSRHERSKKVKWTETCQYEYFVCQPRARDERKSDIFNFWEKYYFSFFFIVHFDGCHLIGAATAEKCGG